MKIPIIIHFFFIEGLLLVILAVNSEDIKTLIEKVENIIPPIDLIIPAVS